MDRRNALKALVAGPASAGVLVEACNTGGPKKAAAPSTATANDADRMTEEKAYNKTLQQETFFTPHELATIAVLTDVIIPKDEKRGSATDAGVPDDVLKQYGLAYSERELNECMSYNKA